MSREKIYLSLIISLLITFGVTMSQVIFAAWEDPTALAPASNTKPFIDESAVWQQKQGSLIVGNAVHGNPYGLTVQNGIAWTIDGLRIESKVGSDPITPQVGRIWIRH